MKFKISSLIVAILILAAGTNAMADGDHTGVIIERMDAEIYTYMKIDEDGKEFWIAGPKNTIPKGTKVFFVGNLWMPNFKSKTLNRTFDRVLLVSGVNEAPSGKAEAAAPKASSKSKFKKEGTLTISEVYSKKAELKGKMVKVSGKVVKVNNGIMGKNWVHLQDGTGAAGNNDLLFISKTATATVGDTVTATGRLQTDVNYGQGYFYAVIIDSSTFAKD